MENLSRVSTNLILFGLVEMERFKYLYFVISLGTYLFTIFLCSLIVFIIWTEASLHDPMHLFICNLLLNGMFGNMILFPKLMIDLLSGSKVISLTGCLIQSFCMHVFAAVELFTFTLMAQDRYLAVGQPLRYSTLMTNQKALTYIAVVWVISAIAVLVPVIMTAQLPLCGTIINSVFCDNMSLIRLACEDASVNNIFGAVEAFLINIISILIVIYCYIQTFRICLKVSREAYQKALRTLVTHLVAFSNFMVATSFVLLRYRLNSGTLSLNGHILLSVTGFITPSIVNPLLYGIRTESLKLKVIQNLNHIFNPQDFKKANK
ncbi:olfactory receptor 4B13-like [Pelodytes ibericus]